MARSQNGRTNVTLSKTKTEENFDSNHDKAHRASRSRRLDNCQAGQAPPYFGVGVCRPVLKTLILFQTRIYGFPYPISDPVMCGNFGSSQLDLRRTGNMLLLKMVSQIKQTEYTPYFRLEMLESDTLWGGRYLYGLHIGVAPHPQGQADGMRKSSTEQKG